MASKLDRLDRNAPAKKPRNAKAAVQVLAELPEGTLQDDYEYELNEVQTAFKARAKAEEIRFELATDSEYWTCLCFQTREQAEAFAAAVSWLTPGDKYVDGVQVARALGIELPAAKVPYNTSSKKDRKLIDLTD